MLYEAFFEVEFPKDLMVWREPDISAIRFARLAAVFLLQLAALEKGQWWLVALIVIASLLTMLYVGRLVEAAYFREPSEKAMNAREAPLAMLIPAYVLVAATIFLGLNTTYSVGLAQSAAASLLSAMY